MSGFAGITVWIVDSPLRNGHTHGSSHACDISYLVIDHLAYLKAISIFRYPSVYFVYDDIPGKEQKRNT